MLPHTWGLPVPITGRYFHSVDAPATAQNRFRCPRQNTVAMQGDCPGTRRLFPGLTAEKELCPGAGKTGVQDLAHRESAMSECLALLTVGHHTWHSRITSFKAFSLSMFFSFTAMARRTALSPASSDTNATRFFAKTWMRGWGRRGRRQGHDYTKPHLFLFVKTCCGDL